MRVSWGYQFADFYPDERREQGQATEAEALAALHDFPWAEQRRQLTARHHAGLTSTPPGLWLYRADDTLRLLAPDATNLLVEYQHGGRRYSRHLSLNWHDDHPLPDEPIRAFFAGTLAEWPYWQEATETKVPEPPRLQYASAGQLPWLAVRWAAVKVLAAWLLLGLLAAFTSISWLWLLGLAVFVSLMQWFEVGPLWQHARLAHGQRVEVDVRAQRLTLHDRHGTLTFGREQVRECVIVRSTPGRYVSRATEYVAFVLDSGQVCVIPAQTAPATVLADALNLHYRVEKTSGFIRHRRRSAAALAAQQAQVRQLTTEFEQRFAHHSTAELRAIVARPEHYARHAVAAATELLRQRGESNEPMNHE